MGLFVDSEGHPMGAPDPPCPTSHIRSGTEGFCYPTHADPGATTQSIREASAHGGDSLLSAWFVYQ